ncbi:glycosyltransferase family 4 protein [Neisseria sp. CCUG12390]|uniref:glycosyltransferase family 4 protein n=1 Tax=Neisseria sp. CCUG12390 TaxID=3392035 RepID=UPI003A101D4E
MKPHPSIAINCFRRGGGMESYTFDLVRGLAAGNIRPTVYAAQIDRTVPEYALAEAVHVNQRFIPKKLRPYFFGRQLATVRRRRADSAPLVACNPSDNADVFVCGGTHLGYLKHMNQRANLLDKLTIRRNRTNYATAKSIMAHSAMMAHELTEYYGVPSEKIRVVYPPADTKRYFPQPERTAELRHQFGFGDNETVFVFPSTGHKRKGLDVLAAFFEQTDLPVRLAVAGSPLPRPMKNVTELGFCSNMPDLYRAADFTVMASLYEPFGLVGVESVLSGTQVVFADNIACTEIMNGNAGLFFQRSNPGSLAAAIAEAHERKLQGCHKIADPFAALDYDPTLSAHIRILLEMLAAVD